MMRFIVICYLALLGVTTHALPSDQIRFAVEKYQLPNGLTVLIAEDHKMPLVSYQQWFRVGSSYEKPGHTGLAHFFEHLMFKGTIKHPEVEFNQLMQANGANFNAFTTEDYTGFYINLPSDKVELAIDIESDRMHNLQFDIGMINSEREVVKEERRMRYENSVSGSLWELFRTTRYKTGPYSWPVIGYMPDLNSMKLEEFKDFYQLHYAPNNAVVVVVGDVNTKKVKKLIEKYYGPIPASKLPAFDPTPETEQKAPRTAKLEKEVQGVSTLIGYPGVKAGDSNQYALDMLCDIMSGGSSSRLFKKLVYDSKLATNVSMSAEENKLSGDIVVGLGWVPGANVSKGQAILETELKKVKTDLVTESEMTKVRNSTLLGYVRGLQTVSSKAHALAYNEIVFNDYHELFTALDKMNDVTREQIRDVANKYLVPQMVSNVEIVPGMPKTANPKPTDKAADQKPGAQK